MFIHLAVHRPYSDKADLLAESMRRFGAAMSDKPGLQQVYTLRDQKTGAMIGLAIWDSKEDWEAARPAMLAAIENDPFGEWEENPPDVFHLDVLFTGKP
jgi:hypothetical protein